MLRISTSSSVLDSWIVCPGTSWISSIDGAKFWKEITILGLVILICMGKFMTQGALTSCSPYFWVFLPFPWSLHWSGISLYDPCDGPENFRSQGVGLRPAWQAPTLWYATQVKIVFICNPKMQQRNHSSWEPNDHHSWTKPRWAWLSTATWSTP